LVTDWDSLPQVLTLTELCAVLRVSRALAVRMIERGEIAARKVGREWRIDKDALIAYLNRTEVA
jgi:excisionase family DNA binding protein